MGMTQTFNTKAKSALLMGLFQASCMQHVMFLPLVKSVGVTILVSQRA